MYYLFPVFRLSGFLQQYPLILNTFLLVQLEDGVTGDLSACLY